MVVYGATHMWGPLIGVVPLAVYSLGLYRLIKLSRGPRVHVLLGLVLFATITGSVTQRPALTGHMAWTLLLPMISTLLVGVRAGVVWTAIALAAQGLASLCIAYDVFPSSMSPSPMLFQTLSFASISITCFVFSKQSYDYSHLLLMRAQEADEAKTVFLANISHEIRTPLNGVLGMTEVMLLRELAPAEREDLEVVHRSGATLLRLINDLLDLTKAERAELTIEELPFDLDRLLRDVMEFVPHQEGVHTQLDSPPWGTVLGDPTRVRQVLTNLVSNAAKFTAQGHITLQVRRAPNQQLAFEISDTGFGMSPQTIEALFTPFRQADASIARRFGGTGLGLALVKTLTERMGGTVSVSSVVGQGSRFSVCLPLKPTTRQVAVDEYDVPDLTGIAVLVVDDNTINLKVASGLLARTHCQVHVAETGEAALELLAHHKVALVLMDCQLPGIDGWEATRRIHAIRGLEQLPVFALTASNSPAELERSRLAGMRHVLAKPLGFAQLCHALRPFARTSA